MLLFFKSNNRLLKATVDNFTVIDNYLYIYINKKEYNFSNIEFVATSLYLFDDELEQNPDSYDDANELIKTQSCARYETTSLTQNF